MTSVEWTDDPFFEAEGESVDGGTTSVGLLWHEANARWGHSMHTMCSYHGMFPAKVAHYFIDRYTHPGQVVLDPFSGRGTTALQARVEGRVALGNDLSPLAYILSKGKVNPPTWGEALHAIDDLETKYRRLGAAEADAPDDIRMLYHPNTLQQICFIRRELLRSPITSWSGTQAMTAGSLAGIMHGAHRRDGSSQYLSISMPNTFSMSPAYVRKYISENGLTTLDQNVFECLRDKLARLYLDGNPGDPGMAYHEDAAGMMSGPSLKPGSVDLLVTSPPYLRVVNYGSANWIRLWLLGLDDVSRDQGAGRQTLDAALDHGHSFDTYKAFMSRTFRATARVLKKDGIAVFVIGDVADPGKSTIPLAAEVWADVGAESGLSLVEMIDDHLPVHHKVSRIWGETKGQATEKDGVLILARSDGTPRAGRPEIDWDEPYKDAGPDEAHQRVARSRARSTGRAT